MQSRNVILSLILVLVLLAFTFMKVRFWEPKKKLSFNRNPRSIKYSPFTLCRMDCFHISANDITEILKKGDINLSQSNLHARPCPIFAIGGITKRGVKLNVIVVQCGTVITITSCGNLSKVFACDCPTEQNEGVSFLKIKT